MNQTNQADFMRTSIERRPRGLNEYVIRDAAGGRQRGMGWDEIAEELGFAVEELQAAVLARNVAQARAMRETGLNWGGIADVLCMGGRELEEIRKLQPTVEIPPRRLHEKWSEEAGVTLSERPVSVLRPVKSWSKGETQRDRLAREAAQLSEEADAREARRKKVAEDPVAGVVAKVAEECNAGLDTYAARVQAVTVAAVKRAKAKTPRMTPRKRIAKAIANVLLTPTRRSVSAGKLTRAYQDLDKRIERLKRLL